MHWSVIDWPQPHSSNLNYSGAVWSGVITKNCEWISPTYSANLLAPAYDVFTGERWLLLSSVNLNTFLNKYCWPHLVQPCLLVMGLLYFWQHISWTVSSQELWGCSCRYLPVRFSEYPGRTLYGQWIPEEYKLLKINEFFTNYNTIQIWQSWAKTSI